MENQETIPKSDNQYNNLSFGGTLEYIFFYNFSILFIQFIFKYIYS
jgi:hypothetical protein